MDAYFLYGVEDEMLMVIRGTNEATMLSIINKLKRSKEDEIRTIAEILENHFYERDTSRRSAIKAGPKDPQNGGQRRQGRNTKTKNTKPIP